VVAVQESATRGKVREALCVVSPNAKEGRLLREEAITEAVSRGVPHTRLVQLVAKQFMVEKGVVVADLVRMSNRYRELNDNEGWIDLIMADTIDKVRSTLQQQHAIAAADTGELSRFEPKELAFILQQQNAAAKNVLTAAETLARLLGRRSQRWNQKSTITHEVVGESPEHRAQVLRLLGKVAEADSLLASMERRRVEEEGVPEVAVEVVPGEVSDTDEDP
jgi:hypothetical protein